MPYVLGLDIGARSIGWALVEREKDRELKFLGVGVRVFEAGTEGNIEEGKDESRGAARRLARNTRRQIRRRRQRARQLYSALAEAGLLPAVETRPGLPIAVSIQRAINELDAGLRGRYAAEPAVQQLPYLLRSRALDSPLESFEFGRALYHLGQRRGFKSNRKADSKKAEEKGVVYGGIHDLNDLMRSSNARTLGEYFSRIDPAERRIRARYTHRSMYEQEFDAMWKAQESGNPVLNRELKDRIWHILFDQRPLKDASDLVGACEWEPEEKRAPVWSLEFQRFRALQNAVHLRVQPPGQASHALSAEQRATLVAKLETTRELSIASARKLLNVPRSWVFSVEAGGEKKLKGNPVSTQFLSVLGDVWPELGALRQSELVEAVARSSSDEELAVTLITRFGFTDEQARQITEQVSLPSGYGSLSLKAIRAVTPFLEQGLSVQEARQAAGYQLERQVPVHDLLPPVLDSGIEILNPAVKRTLTELRKVVNAIVRKHGKPEEIHIEVARELKKSREARFKEVVRMRDREKQREAMRIRIADATGMAPEQVRRRDIEIGLLFDECGGICPYSGEPLGAFVSLYSGNSRVQVEHIIPRSISLDDSFANLTLCLASENALKKNRTPFEAYGSDAERWSGILERVGAFKGRTAGAKLDRFLLDSTATQEILAKFGERHLNDTRYSSVLAARYLSLLFGGEIVEGTRKILKSTGQITAFLRDVWDLNAILHEGPKKNRDDHRHHAIDAAVIAIVGQRWIQELSSAAERATSERKRRFASVPPPWVGFKEQLIELIGTVNISFRPDHRVTGALHKETFYTIAGQSKAGGQTVRTRKPVQGLSKEDIARIADPMVRSKVEEKLAEVGDPKKFENNWPTLPNANGKPVPIKKVRLNLNRAVQPVGKGHKLRWAEGSETHHVEVFEILDGKKPVWGCEVVSMRDAYDRIRRGLKAVNRDSGGNRRFLFSLCKGDTVQLTGDQEGVWVVRKIRQNTQVIVVPQHDARPEGQRVTFAPTISSLRSRRAHKVAVSPLGELLDSNE